MWIASHLLAVIRPIIEVLLMATGVAAFWEALRWCRPHHLKASQDAISFPGLNLTLVLYIGQNRNKVPRQWLTTSVFSKMRSFNAIAQLSNTVKFKFYLFEEVIECNLMCWCLFFFNDKPKPKSASQAFCVHNAFHYFFFQCNHQKVPYLNPHE